MTTDDLRRVLTIRQPWADLVLSGLKDVENRTWPIPQTIAPTYVTCLHCGARRRKGDWWEGDVCWTNYAGRTYRHSVEDDRDPFPFRLWIHSAASSIEGSNRDGKWDEWQKVMPAAYPVRGALLGSVTVTGCHHADDCEQREPRWDYDDVPEGLDPFGATRIVGHCSRWAEPDVWHWTLTDPQPLKHPIPMRGQQGLWRLPDGVEVPA